MLLALTNNEAKDIFQSTHLLILYQKLGYHFQIQDYYESNRDDYPLEEMEVEDSEGQVLLQLQNGTKFTKRNVPRIIWYVNYNRDKDPENYFRE